MRLSRLEQAFKSWRHRLITYDIIKFMTLYYMNTLIIIKLYMIGTSYYVSVCSVANVLLVIGTHTRNTVGSNTSDFIRVIEHCRWRDPSI